MFEPPRCPNPSCAAHIAPSDGCFKRHGSYQPKCRPHPVPRFLCKLCERSFSRQTFRADWHDHKPHVNAELISRLASGCGLRQTARELGLSVWGVQKKFRKLAKHLTELHANLLRPVDVPVAFAFDEAESFEGNRRERPLTVPVVIEQRTMFVVAACSGTLPARGKRHRRRRNPARAGTRGDAPVDGRRRSESRRVVAEALAQAARMVGPQASLEIRTDRKTSYSSLIKAQFGRRPDGIARELEHQQVSSKAPRNTSNPLHRINLTLAMTRDLLGRLRRRSWLHTKRRRYLDLHLGLFACYRNYVRVRFNDETATPAELLGLLPRRLSIHELLSWRQDFGPERSVHPLARYGESVATWQAPPTNGAEPRRAHRAREAVAS